MSVKVEWVGHACFRVWREGGPVIVMDPYTPKTVYLPEDAARVEGDTVIVSSLTDDAHGYPELVRGRRRVIDALDVVEKGLEVEVDGSPLVTVGAAESPIHDSGSPKDNALYALQVGGVWVMHMGDLGYGLPREEVAPFEGRCEVMLAIVGQYNTLSLPDLDAMIDHLKPRWIVPMHFALPPVSGPMRPLREFLDRRREDPLIFPRSSVVEFPIDLPVLDRPTIVALEPSGYQPTVGLED